MSESESAFSLQQFEKPTRNIIRGLGAMTLSALPVFEATDTLAFGLLPDIIDPIAMVGGILLVGAGVLGHVAKKNN